VRQWGSRSLEVFETLDPRLQAWCDIMLQDVADISLVYGYRNEELQTILFDNDLSQLRFPDSKHNRKPSLAVDLQPYPRPLKDNKLWGALGYLAGRGVSVAEELGITLRWGGDWDRDGDLTDQNFNDLFHWEIYN